MHTFPRLVADIGATHARFALIREEGGPLERKRRLLTGDFPSLRDAISHYLRELDVRPSWACLAVAGVTSTERIRLTRVPSWSFTRQELQREFGFRQVCVLNDIEAVALAVAELDPASMAPIGGGIEHSGSPLAIVAPGTGLGMAQMIPCTGRWHIIATEGGHSTMAPGNEREHAVFGYWLTAGSVLSREHFLRGPGILRIYQGLCALDGVAMETDRAEEISRLAVEQDDPLCTEALSMFLGLLGSACGDQVLATGARGGLYLAGGVLPQLREQLETGPFRERFEDKGMMSEYTTGVRTWLITAADPALDGASRMPIRETADY